MYVLLGLGQSADLVPNDANTRIFIESVYYSTSDGSLAISTATYPLVGYGVMKDIPFPKGETVSVSCTGTMMIRYRQEKI